VPITEFINECRGVQNAVSPQEEKNIIILRGKLRGRARKAPSSIIINIEEFIGRLKTSFRIMGDIFGSYAEICRIHEALRKKPGKCNRLY